MSSLKRKGAPSGSSSAKDVKPTTEARPSKKAKSEKPPKKEFKKDEPKIYEKATSKPAPTTTAPAISRLKEEEPLFPRGGGSILSPLEHKQIQIQAKNDALFEEASEAPAKKGEKGQQKKKRKSATKDDKAPFDEDAVKIESLNYKRLVKGSLVLGQVCEINDLDIALALPNNLVGHVSITSVSPGLTKRVEEAAEADEDDDADAEDVDVDLKSLFELGQYLRAYVISTIEDTSAAAGKAKRHIELSLRPEETNVMLSEQDVVANSTVMAAVASVEDHGYVMDVSIADSKLTGFLPKKEVDSSMSESRMQPGTVLLCMVTSRSTNRKVVQLSTQIEKMGSLKNFPSQATTINTYLPGTAVDVLVTELSARGIAGKVMGHLDVTADDMHSGVGPNGADLEEKYQVGSRLKARVICTFPDARKPKLGISVLEHVTSLKPLTVQKGGQEQRPLETLPISSVVETCTVKKVETDIGLFVDIGVEGVPGFVHISRVKDGKVDALYESSGPFKVGSEHRGRVVGYNAFDGIFLLSFQQSIIDTPFWRIEDVPVGQVVDGVIEKLLIGETGVTGLIVKLAEGITGLAPEMHLSDVRLQHPEKKFKEGMKVKARVLSTDPAKRQLRLTLKKTLVNTDTPPIKSFDEVSVGLRVLGTIIKVVQNGAIVQFYGSLRGFLPLSEMSEAYIKDPNEHFRPGQVVNVHVLEIDADANRLVVSCKDPSAFGMDKQLALKNLKIGGLVSGKVSQKTEDDVFVELEGSLLKAVLSVGHLSDKSSNKNHSALKRIHVGQTLTDLVLLEKNEGRRALTVSQKPSLVTAAKEGKFPSSWDQVKVGDLIQGFVRNMTSTAVFVQFAGVLTALLPSTMIPQEKQKETDFGLQKLQSISVKVVSINGDHSRAVVAVPSVADAKEANKSETLQGPTKLAENPLDGSITSLADMTVGRITKAKIVSVKNTQLNVQLADNIQGRVDVSQVFDSWDAIPDPKNPLKRYRAKQIIDVKVLGVHDARNHRFLPISHRSTNAVIELSAKPSDLKEEGPVTPLSLDTIEVGSSWVGFVNNIRENSLWVNLSPTVRGRVNAYDASDDLSRVSNLSANFPIGSAMCVKAIAVTPSQKRLDLSARSSDSASSVTWDNIKKNLILPGKVTKINDRQVFIKLSEDVSAPVHLIDLDDNYDEADPKKFTKNDILRVAIVDVDTSNKRIRMSTRPSRVLNSNLPVTDPEITTVSSVKSGEVVRGFVKNVSDKGLFVTLGGHVTAFVKITDLSDSFLKEWKPHFQLDQIVKGRITAVDTTLGQVNMSLKASVVDKDHVSPPTIADFKEGQVVTGKVRAVEEFGAFIVIDKSANVSGLCHKSEMAEKTVKDARKLYSAGDVVKARILKIDLEKKKINFGLKASYFEDDDDEAEESDEDAGATLVSNDDENDSDEDDEMDDAREIVIRGTDNQDDSDDDEDDEPKGLDQTVEGLDAGGFDWSGAALDIPDELDAESDAEADSADKKKKKRRKPEIQVDRTGEMDAHGPQTGTDFERLLLGQPDSSELWIQYMAFQVQVSEPAKAREVAERALRTINIREEVEKLNMWIAYLNLENAYGTDETLEEVFKRACQFNDEQTVYERLSTIYIKTSKPKKADELFQAMVKKFGARSPDVWLNFAHFLHVTVANPSRARELLGRATQALEVHTHPALVAKFAALEWRSPNGDTEFGRTIFEGLLSAYPKKLDLWDQLLDLEMSAFKAAKKGEGKGEGKGKADSAAVRDVFERGTKIKGLKPRRAKTWFQRWAKWEEENGDSKSRDRVSAKAKEWAREAEARKSN